MLDSVKAFTFFLVETHGIRPAAGRLGSWCVGRGGVVVVGGVGGGGGGRVCVRASA